MKSEADTGGHFGEYGGSYVPETLVAALKELREAYPLPLEIAGKQEGWVALCGRLPGE